MPFPWIGWGVVAVDGDTKLIYLAGGFFRLRWLGK